MGTIHLTRQGAALLSHRRELAVLCCWVPGAAAIQLQSAKPKRWPTAGQVVLP
jgi:hypothetical protein